MLWTEETGMALGLAGQSTSVARQVLEGDLISKNKGDGPCGMT